MSVTEYAPEARVNSFTRVASDDTVAAPSPDPTLFDSEPPQEAGHTMAPAPHLEMAHRFLGLLDPDAKEFDFRCIFDPKEHAEKKPAAENIRGSLERASEYLHRLNSGQLGVFVSVNETDGNGVGKSNIKRIRTVFADFDAGWPADLPLEPSIVVQTSPTKFQAYWLIADEMTRPQFDGVLSTLIARHGSDKGAKDISRVLRVPGFFHHKRDPFLVKLTGGNGRRYTAAEIVAAYGVPTVSGPAKAATTKPPKEPSKHNTASVSIDAPETVDRAIRYLAGVPTIPDGSGRNTTAFTAAATLGDFGLSCGAACEVMLAHFRCAPMPNPTDLRRTVENSFKYRQKPIGCDYQPPWMPANDVEALGALGEGIIARFLARVPTSAEPTPQIGLAHATVKLGGTYEQLANLPETPWIVRHTLQRGKVTLISAEGGAGKSLYSLNLAIAVATGDGSKLGEDVLEDGRVLIVNDEDDINQQLKRLYAACLHHGFDPEFLEQRIEAIDSEKLDSDMQLASRDTPRANAAPMFAALKELIVRGKFSVVVLDPLRALHDFEENSNSDMKHVVRTIGRLARETNTAILLVHHINKTGAQSGNVAGNAHAAGGASSIVTSVRLAKTMVAMTNEEGDLMGIESGQRRDYFRIDDAKMNHQRRGNTKWYQRISITVSKSVSKRDESAPTIRYVDLSPDPDAKQRREEIISKLRNGSYSAAAQGSSTAASRLATLLGVSREIVKTDLAALERDGSIRRQPDATGRDRWQVIEIDVAIGPGHSPEDAVHSPKNAS